MDKLYWVYPEFSNRMEYVLELWNTQIYSPKLIYSPNIPKNSQFILYENSKEFHAIPNSGFLLSNKTNFDFCKVDEQLEYPNFDFFSYVFAMATECYHYVPDFPKDFYGRYDERFNPVIIHQINEKPFFPFWANKICNFLKIPIQYYPKEPLWITLDIDNPFYFQYRGFYRQLKSFAKSLLKLNFRELIYKLKIITGFEKDPFHSDNWLNIVKNHQFLVFFLMNNQKYHSNTSPKNPFYIQEILKIPPEKTGIHFSLNNHVESKKMFTEKNYLENIVNQKITKSRQHFLHYEVPTTFHQLLELGIEQDYTTCFYSKKGYKHGFVRPFRWYNLLNEEATNLLRYPVFFMDRHALKESMNYQETIEYIENQINIIQNYGGIPIILFHNETFSGIMDWKSYDFRNYF